ncbi:peptidoglycan recognition protein 5 [Brachionichthys hirsutus]|uniref:peptidoglycan recognition protein 5 n=1 Tax=Brachionichthys hirsutus TaxID=412623 RepID=UPI0036045148
MSREGRNRLTQRTGRKSQNSLVLNMAVVTRSQWGAAAPLRREFLKGPAQRVVIHHTATQKCTCFEECKKQLISIQRDHMTKRHFDDIGYNFLVSDDGTVFEGRGWGVVGAHAKGYNHDSVGIAFMGNFTNDTPSTESLSAVKELLSGASQEFLQKAFVLQGHRDLKSTACPGDRLYAKLPDLLPEPRGCKSPGQTALI